MQFLLFDRCQTAHGREEIPALGDMPLHRFRSPEHLLALIVGEVRSGGKVAKLLHQAKTLLMFVKHGLHLVFVHQAGQRRVEILLFEGDMGARIPVEVRCQSPSGRDVIAAQGLRKFIKRLSEEGVVLGERIEKISIFFGHRRNVARTCSLAP